MDFDWGHHHVIYHGWDRPGWVNRARPRVHLRNVYINQSRPSMDQIWRHDRSRGDPARYLASRPSGPKTDQYTRTGEGRGQTMIPPGPAGETFGPRGDTRAFSNRGKESRGIVNRQMEPLTPGIRRPTIPAPTVSHRPTIPAPGSGRRPTPVIPQVSRPAGQPGPAREGLQPGRTPSVSFGGYRGADEARTQSLRGQTSRQSTVRPSAPAAGHGRAPSGRSAPGEKQRR